MKRASILLFCGLAACTVPNDGSFRGPNGIRVNPVSQDVFEVIARPVNEVRQFWCGAGEYAYRELGAPLNAKVYIVGGAGRGFTEDAPSTMQFSLKPPGEAQGASGRPATWGPKIGEDEFVGDARRYCHGGFFPGPY